jgi:glycosyl transferase family 25
VKFVKFVVEKKDKGMEKVIVIHAKHLRERMVHMERQLRDWPGEVVYVTEADKDELTDEMVRAYIKEGCELDNRSGATSCAIKHIKACQYIVDHQLEGALVLEDDIVLHQGFEEDFAKTIEEYRQHYADQPIIISYEDSSLQFIPRSRRKKGQWLYEAPHGRVRFNGALYINQKAAQAIVDDVKANKCDIAVDHYYMHLYGKGLLQFLWCEPALATQGSFNGSFVSSMGQIRSLEGLRWKLKYAYKRLVYWFR